MKTNTPHIDHTGVSKETLFIISGEASGDQHGHLLISELKKRNPEYKFFGIGGAKMISEGLESFVPLHRMAVMGFVEVLKHIRFFQWVAKLLLEKIQIHQPAAVILIDYPGFNLRLAKMIKDRFDIPVIYYISPQIWAWKEKRVEQIRQYIDLMLVIFPFESEWYAERNVKADFVGHPFLDAWSPRSRDDLKIQLGLNPKQPVLMLFPGSRKQELDRHLDLFIKAAQKLKETFSDLQILLGLAPDFNPDEVHQKFEMDGIQLLQKNGRIGLEAADLAFVASGTATMEAAIFGTPMVIVYKMAGISWWIGQRLIKVPYAGMANLIARDEIVPELLQNAATPDSLAESGMKFLQNNEYCRSVRDKLADVRNKLGGPGASGRAADKINLFLKDLN